MRKIKTFIVWFLLRKELETYKQLWIEVNTEIIENDYSADHKLHDRFTRVNGQYQLLKRIMGVLE